MRCFRGALGGSDGGGLRGWIVLAVLFEDVNLGCSSNLALSWVLGGSVVVFLKDFTLETSSVRIRASTLKDCARGIADAAALACEGTALVSLLYAEAAGLVGEQADKSNRAKSFSWISLGMLESVTGSAVSSIGVIFLV
jgi:hypothetical protein